MVRMVASVKHALLLGMLVACAATRPKPLQPSLTRVQMEKLGPLVTGTTQIDPNAQASDTSEGDFNPAEVEFCIDEQGKVFTTQLAKSSDNYAYDDQLEREIRKWSFAPYRVGGAATRVCSAASFREGAIETHHSM